MKKLLAFILLATSVYLTIPAQAETYEAGEFTIILDMDRDEGRTYYGCDLKDNCVYLVNGTSWQNKGCRGITWENQGYTYSISWQERNNDFLFLKVFNPQNQLIIKRLMKPKI